MFEETPEGKTNCDPKAEEKAREMDRKNCKYSDPIQQTIYLDGYKDAEKKFYEDFESGEDIKIIRQNLKEKIIKEIDKLKELIEKL